MLDKQFLLDYWRWRQRVDDVLNHHRLELDDLHSQVLRHWEMIQTLRQRLQIECTERIEQEVEEAEKQA